MCSNKHSYSSLYEKITLAYLFLIHPNPYLSHVENIVYTCRFTSKDNFVSFQILHIMAIQIHFHILFPFPLGEESKTTENENDYWSGMISMPPQVMHDRMCASNACPSSKKIL